MNTDRPLYQQILLLSLDSKRGTPVVAFTHLAVAGAVMAEWLIDKRISVDDSRRLLVTLEDAYVTGDPVLDACLHRLKAATRKAPLRSWIARLSRIPRLRHMAAEMLCARGILRSERAPVFWLFSRQTYREVDPMPKKAIIDQMRAAIFSAGARPDARLATLIALANGGNMLGQIFGRQDVRRRKARIQELIAGNSGGSAVQQLSKIYQQAVAAAAVSGAIG
jgi:hypothetical protein